MESQAAEFLVLGLLLLHRIPAYKAYMNMPGYDIVATDPERNTSARVSVKSRWRTGAPGFIISNFECDFVVIVLLNRGAKGGKGDIRDPEFYVVPVSVAQAAPRTLDWGRVDLKNIANLSQYRDRWDLIAEFLATPNGKHHCTGYRE